MIVLHEMLELFQQHRGKAVVIPGRGNRQWHEVSKLPSRDLPLGDPAMGGHAGFALGLAMAMPDEKVVLFDSEGDLQMSLGVLAMVSEHKPKNFYHFLLDNECYATTGGQPVPNAANVAYTNLERLSLDMGRILAAPGPTFVAMKIVPEIENRPMGQRPPRLLRSREQVIAEFRKEFGIAG